MIIDFERQRDLALPSDAVVVVGSGAAGLALTQTLSERGQHVVLVESGADLTASTQQVAQAQRLNQGDNIGLPYSGLLDGRSRNLGGTAQLWHGQCMRFHEIDLETRSWIPHSGWPLPLAALDGHYADAERWMGVTGLGYTRERWGEHPRLRPLDWDSSRLLHDFTEYSPSPLLGTEHRPQLLTDPLVHVLVRATVSRVVLEAGRAVGAEVLGPDGRRETITGRAIVLAAGTIENARILQLSDPAGVGLGLGREHTGRYLQDHPVIRTARIVPHDFRVLQDRYVALHRGRRRLFPKVRLAPEAQRAYGLLDATAVFVHDHDQESLAAARRWVLAARAHQTPERPVQDALTALSAPVPVLRDTFRRYIRHQATRTRPSAVWLQLWLEQAPNPDSRVTLSDDVDELGLRRPRVDWRAGGLERETSRRLTQWVIEDLVRLGVAEATALPAVHDDEAWQQTVDDAFHPAGTTRMSLHPTDGVVDPDLQVHGVPDLFAVGGSVFPTSGYANPTLTIAALAIRLGKHLSLPRAA